MLGANADTAAETALCVTSASTPQEATPTRATRAQPTCRPWRVAPRRSSHVSVLQEQAGPLIRLSMTSSAGALLVISCHLPQPVVSVHAVSAASNVRHTLPQRFQTLSTFSFFTHSLVPACLLYFFAAVCHARLAHGPMALHGAPAPSVLPTLTLACSRQRARLNACAHL